ncbi:LytR/AlgR family response regulator transcription factor [Robinsoniella sp. KNHs210]|uniref:LytR/AlgR family response regulator transcription factor n=1 Tax=Robinsoniella sp. KNHs210 TaxID=1469950 RepID=UPI000481BE05|nr:LytTR family DNA-binding domain-containing protein [Robinsoniella sp. KNHs210]
MLNIAICDDDILITGELDTMLQMISKRRFIDIETEVYWSGEEIATAVQQGNRFDIIYLDIEMGVENGITSAKEIRKYDSNVCIIYVTSHEEQVLESFEVRPFQFLVKPVNEKQIESSFINAYDSISCNDFYFRYNYQRANHKILLRDILYFESNKRKVSIVTETEVFEVYGKLNEIEQNLKKSKMTFLRVHQSFLVNYKYIVAQAYDFIELDNKKIIPISEDRRKIIGEQYCSMEDAFCVDI